MSEFAELNSSNIVLRLVVIDDTLLIDENGNSDEARGKRFCEDLFGGTWIQTFRDGSSRKQQADVGGYYNQQYDIFVNRQPFSSWTLDDNFDWVAPIPKPDDNLQYYWDEESLSWITIGKQEVET